MSSVPLLYRASTRAVRAAAPLFANRASKLGVGLAGRRRAHEVLAQWGEGERDPSRPVAWFHAPSVGEALQAGAVMGALRERRPGLRMAFTHFSPSAVAVGPRVGADVSTYLPWDLPGPIGEALDGLRPSLLAFTKTEVWPVLVEQALRRGVPVAIVAATVPAGAGRLRWPARSTLRPTWASLTLACACSDEDASRLATLGVDTSRIHVTGDPGVDAARERAARGDAASAALAPFRADPRPTIVAGSTWPADEAELFPAVSDARRSVGGLRLIVAPHEPTPGRVRGMVGMLRAAGWSPATLGEVESRGSSGEVDAVVVERLGVLAHLYALGDVAYVGGGFGRRGLHSVLEPAAVGVPVVLGPRHARSAAARALLATGAARAAGNRGALAAAITGWLADPAARERAREHAFVYIGSHTGAAGRTAALLDPLITPRSST